ncbi:MAG: acyl-ACP--UDP-N-acetylglucosamine O-acyltransferase [Planctomycetaceae bacterium]
MSVTIADTAVVDPRAKLGAGVRIGHFSVVGPGVTIGRNTTIENHVTLCGNLTIGENNRVFPGAVLGGDPQDLGYQGSDTRVIIGDGNIIREYVTINRGSEKEDGITQLGDNNFLMAHVHLGHDVSVGDRVVMANNVMIGGHCHIGNDITIAGGVGINQFTTVGSLSFISALSRVLHDVPPFMIVEGQPSKPRCVNTVGLKRHGYSAEDIEVLQSAYKLLYRSRIGVEPAREQLMNSGPIRPVMRQLFDFLDHSCGGRHGRGRDRRRKAA